MLFIRVSSEISSAIFILSISCVLIFILLSDVFAGSSITMTANVLQLQEVGDFGDENCLPPLNLIRSTKLHLTTEPPISCRCCYGLLFLFTFNLLFNNIKYRDYISIRKIYHYRQL